MFSGVLVGRGVITVGLTLGAGDGVLQTAHLAAFWGGKRSEHSRCPPLTASRTRKRWTTRGLASRLRRRRRGARTAADTARSSQKRRRGPKNGVRHVSGRQRVLGGDVDPRAVGAVQGVYEGRREAADSAGTGFSRPRGTRVAQKEEQERGEGRPDFYL